MAEACEKSGATEVFHTEDAQEGEAFTAARRFAIPAVERLGPLLLEDVEIARRNEVTVSVIAHAGDGNTHPLIVHDPTDADNTARAHRAFGEIMELAIALGGTITGEHGVGRLKKAWLPDQLGPDVIALTKRIKDALDPHGILNPGAIL
ncbi:glycolate oxidase FAD-linked subunit [Mycobacteroides abscessus subsp. abscessus]|nr:glycolate oxidase FAD-linked subunit [Mycobacteroides abscessus subsp. abscessus]